ncbi:intraflagellar transport protein 122 homolog [Cyclospora cayetanensis]|uniref:Intraflagellar transport protein 122 homolog n=1 Tax=Cyclospora cayetanensis TaxID=88456 RepID=A0A6P6S3E0_9EIME|nr:intraflagellar transport protein 122 homolog [Cyclospora cayetanensis]
MEGNVVWRQRTAQGDDARSTLWSVACSPDGARLVLGVGCCVLLLEVESGETLRALGGHKGDVNAVAFASDGNTFASGGCDKQVIIWDADGEPLRHCTCSGSVQTLSFNPRVFILAIGTAEELDLWRCEDQQAPDNEKSRSFASSENIFFPRAASRLSRSSDLQSTPSSLGRAGSMIVRLATSTSESKSSATSTSIQRYVRDKVSSRICCLSWDEEGQRLASGQYSGLLVVHDRSSSQLWSQQLGAAVWTVSWRPSRRTAAEGSSKSADIRDSLLVACTFEPSMWLLDVDAEVPIISTPLTHDPLSAIFSPGGDYLVMVGVDGCITLWSSNGIYLQPLHVSGERLEATACCFLPSGQRLAFTNRQGDVGILNLRLPVVHGLHREVYARRTTLCELTVHNLLCNKTVTIPFDELIQKVAVYRQLLAVQLKRCIVISKACQAALGTLEYREVHRLKGSFECSLLLLAAHSVVLCHGNTLKLYDLEGKAQRQWNLKAAVRYVRVLGGPPGAEALLVGLRNGEVLYVYVHQELPLPLLHHHTGIVCVDVSAERSRLAIIDENKELHIFELQNKRSLLPYQQGFQGIVVGFMGSSAFCLYRQKMHQVKIDYKIAIYRYLKKNDLKSAYNLACLGATDNDLKQLGLECLREGDLKLARKCFQRRKDYRAICMLNQVQVELDVLNIPTDLQQYVCRAYAYAFVQNFTAAADEWGKAGLPQRASEMFADLRKWAEARQWATIAAKAQCDTLDVDPKDGTIGFPEAPNKAGEAIASSARQKSATSTNESGGKLLRTEEQDKSALEEAFMQALREAARLYVATGQVERASRVYSNIGATQSLIELFRTYRPRKNQKLGNHQNQTDAKIPCPLLETSEDFSGDHEMRDALRWAIPFFESGSHINLAQEALLSLGDSIGFLKVLMRAGRWHEALSRAKEDPTLLKHVLVPWANELIRRDQPEVAVKVFRQAGREKMALRLEATLLECAISQQLYAQAAARSWALAIAFANMATGDVKLMDSSPCSLACEVTGMASDGLAGAMNHLEPANLPRCIFRYLVCYFRRISEIYGVYFVLWRYASSSPARRAMPAHALLRACAFLWSHALAPLAKPDSPDSSASSAVDDKNTFVGGLRRRLNGTQALGRGLRPSWRLHSWWQEAQAALDRPPVQGFLRSCGIRLDRRVKGIRTVLVLRLMAEAALQIHDYEVAAAACNELWRLALRDPERRERADLAVKIKAASASAAAVPRMHEILKTLSSTICVLCGTTVPLVTSEALPLGVDISCGSCGCPISLEFGTFAPLAAVEYCPQNESEQSSLPTGTELSPDAKGCSVDEQFLTIARRSMLRRQASTSSPHIASIPGPVKFQPPLLSAKAIQQQPREKILWRNNKCIEGSRGSRVLRLLGLPHTPAERALHNATQHEPAAEAVEVDMLMACATCSHLFIYPPAQGQLLPNNPCIFCATISPRTPILPCFALR